MILPHRAPVAAQTSAGQFRDAAALAKFSYVTRNDFRTRKYFVQPLAGGVAVLDYDNDGKLDIFFTNGAPLPSMQKTPGLFDHALLHNGAQWEDRTTTAGLLGRDLGYTVGAAAGDYDNDGLPDLFIAGVGPNALYHNNRNGTFTAIKDSGVTVKPANTFSVGAAWFDYDEDGRLDLVVANYTIWSPGKDFRCVDPTRGEIYCSPTRYVSVPNQLFHNLGNGKFEDVTVKAGFSESLGKGMGISIADYNNDGHQDVFVANDSERNFLYMNQGNGTFKEQGFLLGVAFNDDGVTVNGMGSDAKDFNNDGLVDIFYNDLPRQIWALFVNSGKQFRYSSPQTGLSKLSAPLAGWGAGFIDYDNDGWKDLYNANGDVDYLGPNAKQSDSMFRNMEGKRFEDVSTAMGASFGQKGYHRGSALGDLDNNGAVDIVVTGLNERPRILINSGTAANHWVQFELTGTASARDAIGAKVKITTPSGRVLHNHVSVSVGLMSASDKRVHFGLGTESAVKTVEIEWPSGRKQSLTELQADRIVKVEER